MNADWSAPGAEAGAALRLGEINRRFALVVGGVRGVDLVRRYRTCGKTHRLLRVEAFVKRTVELGVAVALLGGERASEGDVRCAWIGSARAAADGATFGSRRRHGGEIADDRPARRTGAQAINL